MSEVKEHVVVKEDYGLHGRHTMLTRSGLAAVASRKDLQNDNLELLQSLIQISSKPLVKSIEFLQLLLLLLVTSRRSCRTSSLNHQAQLYTSLEGLHIFEQWGAFACGQDEAHFQGP